MKTIVITGSTRGIGFGLADAFLARDCEVVVSGRYPNVVNEAVSSLGEKHGAAHLAGIPCDVTQYDQLQALWDGATKRFGKVDVWINNAGIGHAQQNFWEFDPEAVRRVIETNLVGAMLGSIVAMKGMIHQGYGALYNLEGLGSGGGPRVKGLSLYGTTKAGLKYLDDYLIMEAKETPIIVGRIRPGMVATDMLTQQYEGHPEEWENAKRIFNILSDRVETVTPWLAERVLSNQKNGVKIAWSSNWRLFSRFLLAPFHKRKIFE